MLIRSQTLLQTVCVCVFVCLFVLLILHLLYRWVLNLKKKEIAFDVLFAFWAICFLSFCLKVNVLDEITDD